MKFLKYRFGFLPTYRILKYVTLPFRLELHNRGRALYLLSLYIHLIGSSCIRLLMVCIVIFKKIKFKQFLYFFICLIFFYYHYGLLIMLLKFLGNRSANFKRMIFYLRNRRRKYRVYFDMHIKKN